MYKFNKQKINVSQFKNCKYKLLRNWDWDKEVTNLNITLRLNKNLVRFNQLNMEKFVTKVSFFAHSVFHAYFEVHHKVWRVKGRGQDLEEIKFCAFLCELCVKFMTITWAVAPTMSTFCPLMWTKMKSPLDAICPI